MNIVRGKRTGWSKFGFIVPNIDAMNVRELREFSYTVQLLMQYANLKAQVLEDRLVGRLDSAARLEVECEMIYQKLDKEYQWRV